MFWWLDMWNSQLLILLPLNQLYHADTGHFPSSSNNTRFAKETGDGSPKSFSHSGIWTTFVEGNMIHSMTEHSSWGWATLLICTRLKMGIVGKFENLSSAMGGIRWFTVAFPGARLDFCSLFFTATLLQSSSCFCVWVANPWSPPSTVAPYHLSLHPYTTVTLWLQ